MNVLWKVCLCMCVGAASLAQEDLVLDGRVEDSTNAAIASATVSIRSADGAHRATVETDTVGGFRFSGLSAGSYIITADAMGFTDSELAIVLPVSKPMVVQLELATFVQEVTVRAAMPELALEIEVEGRRLEDQVAQDVGEFIREQPSNYSVRRGAINMDPTVRGLQESEVAMFVDGTRTFAAGPARMDSDISHVSPHAVQSVRIVKGPYALSWGSGAMSAVQLETIKPNFRRDGFHVGGRAGYNFVGNGYTSDGYVTAWGSNDKFRFTTFHNTRIGNDYEDGVGETVQADYESYDTRWNLGFALNPETTLEYAGGYQGQRDIDYPGRILDATFFKTQSHAVDLDWDRGAGGQFYAQFFVNNKDHLMNNDGKPTAIDMPGRVPPFGLDIALPASSDTIGGRAFYSRGAGEITWKAGFDFYNLEQNATRTLSRRSNGFVIFDDIVWPEAKINDIGGYGQVIYAQGKTQVGGTVRVDGVDASAGDVSQFFLDNTEGDLDQTETNFSAAVNLSRQLSNRWMLSLGLGRAVRTANALERYSDRFPSVKFQNAAEFLGNPALAPEGSLEWNVGTTVVASGTIFGFDFFGRNIDDYITVILDPDIPKRLPLSPDVLYRYINGEAQFYGYEAYGSSGIGPNFDVRGSLSYVWAEDKTFDEPAFGIPPLKFIIAGKVKTEDGRRWVELELTANAKQDRVATTRFEMPTSAWQRFDLRAGVDIVGGLGVRLGVLNLANETYATHLNAANPFTRMRIHEPGRAFYAGMEYVSSAKKKIATRRDRTGKAMLVKSISRRR